LYFRGKIDSSYNYDLYIIFYVVDYRPMPSIMSMN
jgi:hypothetical protein